MGLSFMREVKNFVLGFTLSILGFAICNQETSSISQNNNQIHSNVKIDLFKEKDTSQNTPLILSTVSKKTFSVADANFSNKPIKTNSTPQNNLSVEGYEDDEILNINIEDIIPIEINDTPDIASFSNDEKQEKVALLPDNKPIKDNTSPWSITQTSRTKNQLSLPNIDNNTTSYKVAERIKQSIIFPIPDEILSDENLTPTFIKQTPKEQEKTLQHQKQEKPKIVQKKEIKPLEQTTKEKNIFSNISSWFNTETKDTNKNKKIKSPAPVYSSQQQTNTTTNQIKTQTTKSTTKNIGDFYEALQNTKKDYIKNNIVPTELKLSFNKERAEISGQTLRWLKAFSEKSLKDNYYLQVRLDGSAPAELQKKRLNLLYTIFANHGVDINKVDTAFSNVEPNTFIIRTIKNTKTSF